MESLTVPPLADNTPIKRNSSFLSTGVVPTKSADASRSVRSWMKQFDVISSLRALHFIAGGVHLRLVDFQVEKCFVTYAEHLLVMPHSQSTMPSVECIISLTSTLMPVHKIARPIDLHWLYVSWLTFHFFITVRAISFANDDKTLLASASLDGTLSVFSLVSEPPSLSCTLKGHTRPVNGACFWVLSCNASISWYPIQRHVVNKMHTQHGYFVVLMSSLQSVIELVATKIIFILCISLSLLDLDWSAANDFIASASSDGTCRLWNSRSGACLRVFADAAGARTLCCRFPPNNNNLIVVS